jgi:hypothetical protein
MKAVWIIAGLMVAWGGTALADHTAGRCIVAGDVSPGDCLVGTYIPEVLAKERPQRICEPEDIICRYDRRYNPRKVLENMRRIKAGVGQNP